MKNLSSTITHEEHQKNPYSILNATKSFNSATSELEAKERELGQERKMLGASIYALEADLKNVKGVVARLSMEKILSDKKKQVKEIEASLDSCIKEREGMSITDFMGEGSRAPRKIDPSSLRRSTMSDAEKVQFIASSSMGEYLKLQY